MIYRATVFLGALLLFSIQPLIGKLLLPWFGGSPVVWTTCLAFFQVTLLAGYLYAHGLVRCVSPRRQGLIHLTVLLVAAAALGLQYQTWGAPLLPGDGWKPVDAARPTLRLVTLLGLSVGLPFLLLAATSSLVQSWYAGRHPDRSPYPLFALSNTGSLIGLLGYPLAIEPHWPLPTQAKLWGATFLLFLLGMVGCALTTQAGRPQKSTTTPLAHPPRLDRVLWFLLAACPSLVLVATTNHLGQEVASLPLLWVLPLALYLLTMILCFSHPRWYPRPTWAITLLGAMGLLCGLLYQQPGSIPATWVVAGVSAGMFVCGMVCHGELVRLKPEASWLTGFYLTISAGGAAGGLFASLLAPLIFPDFFEFQLGFALCMGVYLLALLRDKTSPLHVGQPLIVQLAALGLPLGVAAILPAAWIYRWAGSEQVNWRLYWILAGAASIATRLVLVRLARRPAASRLQPRGPAMARAAWAGILVLLSLALTQHAWRYHYGAAQRERNFYGVLRVVIRPYAESKNAMIHNLHHGGVLHGYQFQAERICRLPTAYYGINSGVGLAIELHPERTEGRALRIGAIGLGVGTLATYGRSPEDLIRFYELNPAVIRLARDPKLFSYLSRSPAQIEIVPGDARVSLERELAHDGSQRYDVLVIDAFNGGSIPVHLLTLESARLYAAHLKPDGILAFHVTNHHLALDRVLHALSQELGYEAVGIDSDADQGELKLTQTASWILLTRNSRFLKVSQITRARRKTRAPAKLVLWTDLSNNLFQILR